MATTLYHWMNGAIFEGTVGSVLGCDESGDG